MYLVDHLHARGIGVILDWVPSHFPADEHGLAFFDGTHLYEHADPRKGFHPEWGSSIFNYGRAEVRNFLASNALSGSRSTTPTRCAWMPSPRCCTSTTPASRANGSRISTAATKTSRRSRSCAASTRRCTAITPIHRPSPRSRPLGPWCRGRRISADWASDSSGTWAGCTTRSKYLQQDPIYRQVPPEPAHVRPVVRLHGELRAAALARRSRARQRLAHRQDARRRVAAVREPAPAVRLHVGASGQEAAVHGRRIRPAARMAARREPRMARAAVPAARRRAALVARSQRAVPRRCRRCTRATSRPTASSGSTATTATRACSSFLRHGPGRRRPRARGRATSRRCRAATTASACRAADVGRSVSTAMRRTTAAAARAISAGSRPRRSPRTAGCIR